VFDRLKISREKLAYVVDSTAAPVAGLALVSTWVAVEIDYVREGLMNLGPTGSGLSAFDLFVASIPYRFYILMALLYVPLTCWLGRDFGPMLKAERDCLAHGSRVEKHVSAPRNLDRESERMPARWINAAIPISVTVGVVVWLIIVTGRKALAASDAQVGLRDIFGAADSSLALQYGALSGVMVVALLARLQRLLNTSQIVEACGAGARVVLPAITILWMASAVSRMTGNSSPSEAYAAQPPSQSAGVADAQMHASAPAATQDVARAFPHRAYRLYTGEYLKQMIGPGTEEPRAFEPRHERLRTWFPTIVFCLSSVVAFCTGTSWGTMGILMPTVITLSNSILTHAGGSLSPDDPLLLSSIAGVLSGAVFGDHCSPISDTTVLSSQSSGCDHIAHVRTQTPYALGVALIAIVFGTMPIGFGVSCWISLPLQILALWCLARFIGRPVDVDTN
jgi:Na+/H+ antiporter NhaC